MIIKTFLDIQVEVIKSKHVPPLLIKIKYIASFLVITIFIYNFLKNYVVIMK